MKTGRFFGLILSVALLMVISSVPAAAKDHLIVAFEDAVKTMDLWQTTARASIQAAYMIWDPLLERDPKDGSLTPHLVASWKTINDTTWEFKLRPDVKFHNGNPLTAEAVRFTLEERILDPNQKSPTLAGWKWVKKVEVVDDLTFRIITDGPYPLTLERLNVLFPYDPKWIKEIVAKGGDNALSRQAMGTGPFKLSKFIDGDRIEMVRNENYWKKGWPKFARMTIRFIPEVSTRVSELVSGGVDSALAIPPDQMKIISDNKETKIIEVPILRINFWQFDGDGRAPGTPEALKDVRVRQAIWHAVDREAIIHNVLGGHADLVNLPVNPRQFGADTSIKGLEYSPEKARALLKAAGYENGFAVNLWTYTALTKQVNEAAMAYLEKVGIKVTIKDYVGRVGEMEKVTQGGKTDGLLNNTWGSYNIFDADAILPNYFMSPESPYCYNKDIELSNWLRDARTTLDQTKRKELYSKAQKRIIEKVYWMPWFTQRDIQGASKRLFYEVGIDQVPRFQYAEWR